MFPRPLIPLFIVFIFISYSLTRPLIPRAADSSWMTVIVLRPFFKACPDHIWSCDLVISLTSSHGPCVVSYLVTGHCHGPLLYKDVGTFCIL
jgi:hypothetical protein